MSIAVKPLPVAQTYWSPLIIGGRAVDLAHLEPMQIACPCAAVGRPLVVDVIYTNHCFTDHFKAGVHDEALKIMDHRRERVFCYTRHTLSLNLPGIVRGLPGQAVHQTRHERNYVYALTLQDEVGDAYTVFFRIKRDRKGGRDLTMTVESAYRLDAAGLAEVLRNAARVKFETVCSRAFQGKSMEFRKRG